MESCSCTRRESEMVVAHKLIQQDKSYRFAFYRIYRGSYMSAHLVVKSMHIKSKQEGQVALNRSPEFCLADHVPGDTWDRTSFGQRGII